MSIKDALQAIYDEYQRLTPTIVVTVAADPTHPLHERFVWDDSEAARRYRLVQASGLIRSVSVIVERQDDKPPVRVRAFVADRDTSPQVAHMDDDEDDELTGNYRPVEEVVSSDVLRTAWFRSLQRDWQALKRRAGASREFADMVLGDLRDEVG